MADNTGRTAEKIHEDMASDNWLKTEEAKDYGIVGAVITPPPKPKQEI